MRKKVYFPGLNSLRFFSALTVIITHVELMKHKFGFANLWTNKLIFHFGGIGVSFFFVLSGFLVTYLMLEEKRNFNFFSIKNFYLRRILRIWPLYFFILIFGFFILPKFTYIPFFSEYFIDEFFFNLIFYLLILPNIAFSIYHAVPLIGQSWSIGVEEQFYILWPILFNFFKKFSLKVLTYFLIVWISIKSIFLIFSLYFNNEIVSIVKKNLAMLKFENMIIGAIGALILFENKLNILKVIYSKTIFLIALFGIIISVYILPEFLFDGIHLLHSIFFIVIILNVSNNPNTFLKLESSVLNFLGKISYGLYMYHLIVIYFVLSYMVSLDIYR
ncbi:acyltransferase, partial [Bacteroidota bacterium]|nr:acyltransferase [Bacteroidota bacterium]